MTDTCRQIVQPASLLSWRLDRELPFNIDDTMLCSKDVVVILPLHINQGNDKYVSVQLIQVKDATLENVVQAISDFYQMPMTEEDLDVLRRYESSEQRYNELKKDVLSGQNIIKRYQMLPQRNRNFGGLVPLQNAHNVLDEKLKAYKDCRIYLLKL